MKRKRLHVSVALAHEHDFTGFVKIDMAEIDVLKGRDGVYVVLGREPLDLSGRLIRSGEN
ncbi:hypothetical protein [Rhizobacter sp. OV335]|uniref:hypothetical protein n=1 Tax=Rhizobacter sp. OV335 TaxID=1500264 RepID=UPI0009377E92|nr:hypothetical protein [Rhizobacter sp. OV335]